MIRMKRKHDGKNDQTIHRWGSLIDIQVLDKEIHHNDAKKTGAIPFTCTNPEARCQMIRNDGQRDDEILDLLFLQR